MMQNNTRYLNVFNISSSKCYLDESPILEENIILPTIHIFSFNFIIGILFEIFFGYHVRLFFKIIFLLILELIFIVFLWIIAYFLVFRRISFIKSILES